MTELLMPVRLSESIIATLQKRYTLHRLWDAKDPEALVAELAPRIEVMVTAGSILASGMSFMVDAAFIARFPNLKLIANHGVGYDTIDAAFAATCGIMVTNTPDVLTDETADTAFGLVLNTVREFPAAERYLRAGKWLGGPYRLTASLRGKTMGILGPSLIADATGRLTCLMPITARHRRLRRLATVWLWQHRAARRPATSSTPTFSRRWAPAAFSSISHAAHWSMNPP